MTAQPVLYLPKTWRAPDAPPHDVLLFVDDDDGLRFAPLGTDEALHLSADDWAALAAFVAQHTTLPTPARGRGQGRTSGIDEAAVIARLRELSPDGVHMPPQIVWRDERGPGMPGRSTMARVRPWVAWGQLAGLYPHVSASARRATPPDVPPPVADELAPTDPPPAALAAPPEATVIPDVPDAATDPIIDAPPRASASRGKRRTWTDEQVVTALRGMAQGGEMPSRVEWDAMRSHKLPSSQTIVKAHAWDEWAALAGLRASARYEGRKRQRSNEISAAQVLRGDLPLPPTNGQHAPPTAAEVRASAHERSQRELLTAVRAKLHALAVDGEMPPLRVYDDQRGDLPRGLTLLTDLGLTSWGKLAAVCDLVYPT